MKKISMLLIRLVEITFQTGTIYSVREGGIQRQRVHLAQHT